MNFAYDPFYQQLVAGRPADNLVSLFVFVCTNSTYPLFCRSSKDKGIFVTNDRRLIQLKPEIEIIVLQDFI